MRYFIFLLLVSTIGFSQEYPVESPKIVIKVPLGKTIILENYSIKFVKVLEDSRCPKDLTCVWAGRARVRVEIWQKDEDAIFKELIFGKIKQGESSNKVLFTDDNIQIIGLKLIPYPVSRELLETRSYVLLIYESRIN